MESISEIHQKRTGANQHPNTTKIFTRSIVLTSMLLPAIFAQSAIAAPQPHSAAWAKSQILVQPKARLSDARFKRF